ncbi:MAG TPA: response regulator transcription factor [Bryobacteraceae bacterium]|nr:response regulator transcription factor [Bryobacteraceae bacterium]
MIENRTILLIDDEPQIRRVLRASLTSHGASVLDVQNGEEALALLRNQTVDLVLLDMNMPGMGGLETCRAIRSGWDIPIIVVSVRESDKDKVEALDAGADDYVSKPFSFDELMARIRAALRRSGFATDTTPKKVSAPGLEIDFEQRRVLVSGKPVRLTPTEFDILRYLIAHANKPVPHRRLLQAIWGPEYGEQIEYLRVFINQLRKKIEPGGARPVFITTEPRIGYRFVLAEN